MGFMSLHHNIKIRLIDGFISMMLGNMLWPFMTIYFAQKFGAEWAGILLIANVVVGLFASFYGGYVSDKFGRKRVAMVGEVIRFGAFILMAFANSPLYDSAILTFLMFTVNNICWGLTGPAYDSMMIDVSTPENRKFVYSIEYWAVNFSLVSGALIGGFFYKEFRFELFVGVAAAQLLSLILLIFFITETYKPASEQATTLVSKKGIIREMFSNYRLVFRDKTFMAFILASICIMAVERMGQSYIGVRLAEEMGEQSLWSFPIDGIKMFGVISAENSLIVVLATALVTRLIMKRKERRMLSVGLFLYALGFGIMAITNSSVVLLLFMAVATLGELIWVPIKQSVMADLAPEQNRSAYMAVNGLVFKGATVLGSLAVTIGGFLPSWTMSMIIFASGMLGMMFLSNVLQAREEANTQCVQKARAKLAVK